MFPFKCDHLRKCSRSRIRSILTIDFGLEVKSFVIVWCIPNPHVVISNAAANYVSLRSRVGNLDDFDVCNIELDSGHGETRLHPIEDQTIDWAVLGFHPKKEIEIKNNVSRDSGIQFKEVSSYFVYHKEDENTLTFS